MERLEVVKAEHEALKEFQENSAAYEQKVRGEALFVEAQIVEEGTRSF